MNLVRVGSAAPYKKLETQPDDIFRSDGLQLHIERQHPGCVQYLSRLPEIISNPDYIGSSPKETGDSFELVKVFDDNIQIGIKLDADADYWYVATLYDITEAKLRHRIESGRLRTFVP